MVFLHINFESVQKKFVLISRSECSKDLIFAFIISLIPYNYVSLEIFLKKASREKGLVLRRDIWI
ncbi:MAG: hypothetical protein DRN66_03790 [Candidatus Nanohalarchaeota archaeon]|nr:MAG: hypothetical protein DRN66_03790 [Candidatus Nanohaloarchaeota archaeon]